jgi:general stress protein 26
MMYEPEAPLFYEQSLSLSGKRREEARMSTTQGHLELLSDPVAQKLLSSTKVAHLAYNWHDGTPRVVPIWFQWDGEQLVMGSPNAFPKAHAIAEGAHVAISIDDDTWPYKVLLIRGVAHISVVDGVAPEYAAAAEHYFGEEQGKGWVSTVEHLSPQMFRLAVTPEWVGLLDFEQRFPKALAEAMAGA